MRSLLVTAAAIAAIAAGSANAGPPQRRGVPEYGLYVGFPAHPAACPAESGSHLHGWVLPLVGDCERHARSVVLWADWNVLFFPSPAEAAFCSQKEGGSLAAGAKFNLSFPGRPSATCVRTKADGTLLITVVTQAWRQPDARADDPESQTPWVNYYAYLSTDAAHLPGDLPGFRAVLAGVSLRLPN